MYVHIYIYFYESTHVFNDNNQKELSTCSGGYEKSSREGSWLEGLEVGKGGWKVV